MGNLEEIREKVKNCQGVERRKYDGGFCCQIIPVPYGPGVCNYQNSKILQIPQEHNGCRYQTLRFACNFKEQN